MSETRRPHNKQDVDEQFIVDNYHSMSQKTKKSSWTCND